jgi:2,4-dienoyl-CoA reductase-like NADH-dependent reductase (Old Yellow Enzyme family)
MFDRKHRRMSRRLSPGKGTVASTLFEPARKKTMSMANGFVRSATADNRAERGLTAESQTKFCEKLAKGGVEVLITGMMPIHRSGRMYALQNYLTSHDAIPSCKRLTGVVHDYGGKIAVQLCHAGSERRERTKKADEQECVCCW